MKICAKRRPAWPELPEKPVPGRVYQVLSNVIAKGDLYIADSLEVLISLKTGELWSRDQSGFLGHKFRDVTDYVCLDTSRLPPLED